MDYKNTATGETEQLFDAHDANVVEKEVRPESEQEENESHRLWSKVTEGIKEKNLEKATTHKSAIEDAQRKASKEREEKGETWTPKYFTQKGEKYVPKME
jgi:oxysterol-binding protein-related protein 8